MMMLALSLSSSLVLPLQALQGVSAAALVEELATAPRGSREVTLRIEHERLLEQESEASVQDTVAYLRQDGVEALRERHGVAVVDGAEGPAIIVTLHWVRHDDSVYGVSVKTRRPGEQAREVEAFECECIDSGLTKAVLERLPEALAQLEEVAEPVGMEVQPSRPEVGEPSESGQPLGDEATPRRPLGPLGRAGIGVGVVGVGTLVGGGILYALGQRFGAPTGRSWDQPGRDLEPPGIALMVTGGAALVAGVAMLAIDRARARRHVSALLLPSPRGLVLTARF